MSIVPETIKPRWRRLSRRLLFVALALFLLSAPAEAIPIAEYQKNLERAIAALDTLGQRDEDESDANYEHRLPETIAAVRKTLPERQTVEVDGSASPVDNTWLHKRLNDLEKATATEREGIRIQLIERLRSIFERVQEYQKANTRESSKAENSKKLGAILSRPEYAAKSHEGSILWKLLDRFIRWLSKFLPESSPLAVSHGSPWTKVVQIAVMLLAIGVIAFVVVRLLKHFRKRSRSSVVKKKKEPRIVLGEKLEPESSATDLLAEAEVLARTGDVRAAIRKAYIALLVELGDRKVISLAQYKTNRDYLRSVSGLPSLYSKMNGLTNSFERHWYGFAQPAPTDWAEFRAAYLAALGSAE